MTTAERILNLVEDMRAHWMPDHRPNNMAKTLAVLGIIGSTAAVGYGIYKAMHAQEEPQKKLNLD